MERDILQPGSDFTEPELELSPRDPLYKDRINMQLIIYGVTGEYTFTGQLTQGQKMLLPSNAVTIPLKSGGTIVRIM